MIHSIGVQCIIQPDTVIASGVVIGDRVIFDGADIVVERDCRIDSAAIIQQGARVGSRAWVKAGAVVNTDVPANAIVEGNPAKIVGYSSSEGQLGSGALTAFSMDQLPAKPGSIGDLNVGGCRLERLPNFFDMRGGLTPVEMGRGLPFVPQRVFLVYDVADYFVRGEHSHKECEQFLIAANGSLSVVVDDGNRRCEVRLEDRTVGLYLAPKVWGIQYKFSHESVLLVAASRPYESEDYIRGYDEFRASLRKHD